MYTNKIKNFFLLALIVASTIVGSISFPDTAMAAPPGVYVSSAIKKDATASALRTALALCLTISNGGHMSGPTGYEVSAADVANGKWFTSDDEPQSRVGYIVDGDNGKVQCGNLFADRNVAGAFGWGGNIEMACALGMKRENDSKCETGTGGFTKNPIGTDKNKVYAAIDKKYNNATGGNGYNGAQDYLLAATTWKEACDAKAIVTVKDATTDQKNKGYDKVDVVNSKGDVVEVYYDKGNNDKHAWKNNTASFAYYEENCDYMKDQMNANSAAYAKFIKANPPTAEDDTSSDEGEEAAADGEKTSCKVEGIGWIVCPVMRFMAKVVDAAYSMVASLLSVPPITTEEGIYNAWSIMRNFANVAFVIAFLVIIYSQLTSAGITNYGIKKMLPRLIVAAILVNISYWLCAIAVDLSNIFGTSLKGLMDGVSKELFTEGGTAESGAGGVWDVLTTSLIAGTAVGVALYLGLSILLPMAIAALFAIVTVVLILTLRQALIIILIVISPLAFVAYLLPNTESLFKKWLSLFKLLLLLFPIVALLFGGCALASNVITISAGENFILQVVGVGVGIVPLFVTPFVLKASSGFIGRWGGIINNPNKGPFDRAKKGAERYRGKRQNIMNERRLRGTNMLGSTPARIRGDGSSRFRRAVGGAVGAPAKVTGAIAQRNLTRELQESNAEKALAKTKQDVVATRIADEAAANGGESKYAQTIAGPTGNVAQIQAAAVAAKKNETAEAIKNAQISANIAPGDLSTVADRLAAAINDNDDITARAMQNILLTSGSAGLEKYRNTMNDATENPSSAANVNETGKALRENLLDNHGGVKASANDLVQQAINGGSMKRASESQSSWKLSDAELVQQKPASIKLAAASGAISQEQAVRISGNEELAKHLSAENRQKIKDIANRPAPPAPTPPTPPAGP